MIPDVRSQFPALASGAVFFDNPAGTQVPQRVIDAVRDYFVTMNANSGGAFATSRQSDAMVAAVRAKVAAFLNAPSPDDIVLGANMTTLNFALARALASTLSDDAEIVVTRMDHDANVAPWLRLAADRGLTVRYVDVKTDDCTLDLDSLEAALTERTRIVATVHASNAVGTINPVARIAAMVHAAGALHIVDAVQSAPHVPIDVQAIGCDFLLCSSYKFFGPHLGVLYGRHDLLESLPVYKVRPSKDKAPYRWETGTPAFELISGLGATIDYLASLGDGTSTTANLHAVMRALIVHERDLVAHLIQVIQGFGGHIAGITDPARYDERVPTVVFTLDSRTPTEIATHLAQHDVYVWDGNYYAVEIMGRLNAPDGMVRVGLAHYNTHAEIDRFAAAMHGLHRA